MEAVKSFNDELFSIQETRGPISRAKMTKITSIAIKTVKFYKHVVHGVEKFIQRSDIEHKIPGLYVMDSIVRQSIHRFGSEKDVFASRFAKNIFGTFQHLLQCKEDEKVKIVRVLQLWQKNSVFPLDLIQKLLDLIEKSSEATEEHGHVDMSLASTESEREEGTPGQMDSSQILNNVCQMLQSDKAVQINQLLQQNQSSSVDGEQRQQSSLEDQLNQLTDKVGVSNPCIPYGTHESSSRGSNDWDVTEGKCSDTVPSQSWPSEPPGIHHEREGSFREPLGNYLRFHPSQQQQQQHLAPAENSSNNFNEREEGEMWDEEEMSNYNQRGVQHVDYYNNNSRNWNDAMCGDRNISRKRRRGSNERSQRSRSREKRRRSKSRERSNRSDSKEMNEDRRGGDTETRHQGQATIRPNHVLICSRTLWIGHLNKHTTEAELKAELAYYGTVTSLNIIPPRGCAFVTFSTRAEAHKALDRLKGMKVNNNILKSAWAIGSGMKESDLKEFWDVEQGVTHIPWSRLARGDDNDEGGDGDGGYVDLDALAEGGILDEESLSKDLMKALEQKRQLAIVVEELSFVPEANINNIIGGSFPGVHPPVIPPCFPHMPPPLPGMPPLMHPPPHGMMVGMPPPIIPPGAPASLIASSVISPGQGKQPVEMTTPSTGTLNNPLPEVHIPPLSFPPPPMPGWGGPGMRTLPPPMPFPPPPMRPIVPPKMDQNFESEVKPNEPQEGDNEPEFNSHHSQPSYGGPMRHPPMRSPPPWGFNRGGPRGGPHHMHHKPMDEDFPMDAPMRDGGHAFTPNRFNPRFRNDQNHQHHSRGSNNWGRGNFKKNFRQWGDNSGGDEHREDFHQEGERYFDQHRNEEWDRDRRDFPRHQDRRWTPRRNDRWNNEDQGGSNRGVEGRPRWQADHRERDNPRWSRGNHGNQAWDEGRQPHHYHHHHEDGQLKPPNEGVHDEMGGKKLNDRNNDWKEADATKKRNQNEESGSKAEKGLRANLESQDEVSKKRARKSRWDNDADQSEACVEPQHLG